MCLLACLLILDFLKLDNDVMCWKVLLGFKIAPHVDFGRRGYLLPFLSAPHSYPNNFSGILSLKVILYDTSISID